MRRLWTQLLSTTVRLPATQRSILISRMWRRKWVPASVLEPARDWLYDSMIPYRVRDRVRHWSTIIPHIYTQQRSERLSFEQLRNISNSKILTTKTYSKLQESRSFDMCEWYVWQVTFARQQTDRCVEACVSMTRCLWSPGKDLQL